MSNIQKKISILVIISAIAVIAVAAIGLPFSQFKAESNTAEAYAAVANLGRVRLNSVPGATGLNIPNGEFRLNLPKDADGSGFDTYIVTDVEVVNGVQWLGLFVGSSEPVWVMSSQVYPDPGSPQPNILKFTWMP